MWLSLGRQAAISMTNCPRLESSRIDSTRIAVKMSVLDHGWVCRTVIVQSPVLRIPG